MLPSQINPAIRSLPTGSRRGVSNSFSRPSIEYGLRLRCQPRLPERCVAVAKLVSISWLFLFGGCQSSADELSSAGYSQSALHVASREAERIAQLFYAMVIGAVLIWLVVVGVSIFAMHSNRKFDRTITRRLIVGGGAVFPTIVLTGLLAYGLSLMPGLRPPIAQDAIQVRVAGVRWWWRVEYDVSQPLLSAIDSATDQSEDHEPSTFATANELVLPVNHPVELRLSSEDVIHSFWVPALGGKVDMVPGRETRLQLLPTKIGTYRGVCAEYCGESHAHMAFDVQVISQADFRRWCERQRQAANAPIIGQGTGVDSLSASNALVESGGQLFQDYGCGACHAIRGTSADSRVGPDLTHVGGRRSLAAGRLPNSIEGFHLWLTNTKAIKPGVEMPQFGWLPKADTEALAAYLESLK